MRLETHLGFVHQCVVANVDADAKNNRPLAEKYEIGSFPTIKFFPKGNKGMQAPHLRTMVDSPVGLQRSLSIMMALVLRRPSLSGSTRSVALTALLVVFLTIP